MTLEQFESYLSSQNLVFSETKEIAKKGFSALVTQKPTVGKSFSVINKMRSGQYEVKLFAHDIDNLAVANEFFA